MFRNLRRGSNDLALQSRKHLTRTGINLSFLVSEWCKKAIGHPSLYCSPCYNPFSLLFFLQGEGGEGGDGNGVGE